MKILVTFLVFWILTVVNPAETCAERIRGHFNRLPLMKDEALKDSNHRAVKDIQYIWETPSGEYFEVDNDNPPIESMIYKLDKTRQSKPLEGKRDEDLLIDYFHRVDDYAESYYRIVQAMVSKKINEPQAQFYLSTLNARFPGFSATNRALGAVSLSLADAYSAVNWGNKAISANKSDPKALWLLSIGEYARGNKYPALKYYKKAMKIDPKVNGAFWEKEYVREKEPDLYREWQRYITKKK